MYTVKEMAEKIGIGSNAVRERIKRRGIKHVALSENGRVYSEEQFLEIAEDLQLGRPKK